MSHFWGKSNLSISVVRFTIQIKYHSILGYPFFQYRHNTPKYCQSVSPNVNNWLKAKSNLFHQALDPLRQKQTKLKHNIPTVYTSQHLVQAWISIAQKATWVHLEKSRPLSIPNKRHKRLAARCRAGRSRKALASLKVRPQKVVFCSSYFNWTNLLNFKVDYVMSF